MACLRLAFSLVTFFFATARTSKAACGGNLTGYFGIIRSPNFPDTYPDFAHCVWNIQVPKGFRVRVRFTDFDVESFYKCEYDWVMMRSNNRSTKKYCGNKSKLNPYRPSTLTAPGNKATLVFHSDYSNEEKYVGFSAHFVAVDPDECAYKNGGCDHFCHNYLGGHYCSCKAGYRLQSDNVSCHVVCNNQQLTARRGEITSPEYPKHYPKNSNCDWTITVEKGYQISLYFKEFDIEDHQDVPCPYDYLKVSAGVHRKYGPLCGDSLQKNITSSSNYMHIEFVSDPSGHNKGFRAYYETHGIRCRKLRAPANGKMRGRSFSFKDTLQFQCKPGYRLRGSSIRECLSSGRWSGSRPSCRPISCGHPGRPAHGSLTAHGFSYQIVVNYSCDSLFSLAGDRSRRCQADGTWSGSVPRCVPICGESKFNSSRKQQCRQRIVGGHDAAKGSYPWHVLIRKDGHVACGGSLLSENWVLTAAHCVTRRNDGKIFPLRRFQAVLGLYRTSRLHESQVQLRNISKIITHPDFDHVVFDSDLALIKLETEATIADYVRPVCLPETVEQAGLIAPGKFGMAVGWGKTIGRQLSGPKSLADSLKESCMPMIDNILCNQAFQDEGYSVTVNMLCAGQAAGGKDICQGDSGGGFVIFDPKNRKWALGGVVSWGSSLGCGLPNKYGVYVRVTRFLGWIRRNMY